MKKLLPVSKLIVIALTAVALFGDQMPSSAEAKPRVGLPLPAITLPDIAGQIHYLPVPRNKRCIIFFFCGCSPCHECAQLWAQAQQAKEISGGQPVRSPQTIAVFLGDAQGAQHFVTDTGLLPNQTLTLTDSTDRVGQEYDVKECPRVFVVDDRGCLTYTNPDDVYPGDNANHTPLSAAPLISRVLTAWHQLPRARLPHVPERKTAR